MSRFVEELKRRSVIKVALAYLVAAWVLLQVADLLVPILSLPDWTNRLVFLLLVIGFVPALIISWAYELTPEGVVRDEADTTDSGMPTPKTGLYLTAMVSVAIVAAAGWWFMGADERWVRNEALPQLEALAEQGEYEAAYQLSLRVEELSPNNAALEELRPEFTYIVSIPSQPSGATVYRRPHSDPDAVWQELGRTPLVDVYLPAGLSAIRIDLDGYQSAIRVIGFHNPTIRRLPASNRRVPHVNWVYVDSNRLALENVSLDGFARIDGWDSEIGGTNLALEDFDLSLYEVTNREFKAFVDAGGYQNESLWDHPFRHNGEEIDWQTAMGLFVDQSDRPGPSTWLAGSYPDGKEDHPVAGVSWFEAAAYAKFVGRELPTVHHWRQGHGPGMLGNLIPMSNLEGDGTATVGEFPGLNWGGTYDMLGNVREWCFNEIGDGRAILGGAYNDLSYIAYESIQDPAYVDPMDRSPANGFRLARTNDSAEVTALARAPIPVPVETRHAEPVSDAIFEVYRSAYDYDPGPLNPEIEHSEELAYFVRETISIDTSYSDERIALYFFMPKGLTTVAQTVIFWPGIGALYVDSPPSMEQLERSISFLLKNDRAVAFPILAGTFSRRLDDLPHWDSNSGRALAVQQIKDLRRVIDYLDERPDVDRNAFAFYGISWGGRVGPIALAVEPRLKTAILNQAGFNWDTKNEIDTVHFLPRVTQPVLQMNGRYDTDFVYETMARPFFELLGTAPEHKKHVVEPTGHFVPRTVSVGETLDWLDKYLGPVNR